MDPFALGFDAASAGFALRSFDTIGSTNVEAMAQARAGERGPVWFVTDHQSAGRGRRDRSWISPRGNLAASVLEVMDIVPAQAATLGFAAGLALCDALARVDPARSSAYRLKWPNDMLAGRDKLAGILLEAEQVGPRQLAVVVGIGVNVVAAPEGLPYAATSLKTLGVDVNAPQMFAALSDAWAQCRSLWANGEGFAVIRERWLGRAAGLGDSVSVKSGNRTIDGVFETIDEAGCLIVRHGTTRTAVSAGDVHFGVAASAGAA